MSKICFVDNDILLKLVASNLFDEAISSLDINFSDVRILFTASKVFSKNSKIKSQYSDIARNKAVKIAKKCATISIISISQDNLSAFEFLQKSNNIDPGESLLVTATLSESSFFLKTGDKKFLKAMKNNSDLHKFYQQIKGKVICLEQIIDLLIRMEGFEKVLNKILPVLECDQSLKACFGSGKKSEQQIVLENLDYRIQNLQKETGEILAKL